MAGDSCPAGKVYYVCIAGNYRGCCSTDPCSTGVCLGDYDNESAVPTTKTTSSVSKTTAPTRATTFKISSTQASSSSDGLSSVISGSASATFSESFSATSSSSTPPTAASSGLDAGPSTGHNHTGALVGGVIGGIALVAITTILVYYCWRRRRRAKNWDTYQRRSKSQRLDSDTARLNTTSNLSPLGTSPLNDPSYPHSPSSRFSIFSPSAVGNPRNTSSAPMNDPPSSTGGANNSLVIPPLNVDKSNPTDQAAIEHWTFPQSSSKNPKCLEIIPPAPTRALESTTANHRRPKFTPELPDTEFYRARYELSENSQRELINVPLAQRYRLDTSLGREQPSNGYELACPSPISSRTPSRSPLIKRLSYQSSGISPMTPPAPQDLSPPGKVVTTDGVVLGANLTRHSSILHKNSSDLSEGTADSKPKQHVMSFMDFEQGPEMGTIDSLVDKPVEEAQMAELPQAGSSPCGNMNINTNVHDPSTRETHPPKVSPFNHQLSLLGDMPPTCETANRSDAFSSKDYKSPAGIYEL